MTIYRVEISKKIKKILVDLHPEIFTRISRAMQELSENPRPKASLKLSGRDGFRLRIADYRIIYEIDELNKIVIILDLGNRSGIYKQ